MLDLIKRIATEHNMTIVISSHQLHQVERICSRVGIMAKGKLVVDGAIDQLGKKAGGGKFKVEVQLTEVPTPVVEAIKRVRGVLGVERSGDTLVITCTDDLRPQIAKAIVDNNGLLVQMKIQSFALEDIYMKYFKRVSVSGLMTVFKKEIADDFASWRFIILFMLVLLSGVFAIYVAAQNIRSTVTGSTQFVFLALYTTSGEALPSFLTFIMFLLPVVA